MTGATSPWAVRRIGSSVAISLPATSVAALRPGGEWLRVDVSVCEHNVCVLAAQYVIDV